jgi:ankyrin repeat protein
MSNLLWKFYLEDDVEKFRRLLANSNYQAQHSSKGHGGGTGYTNTFGSLVGSPGGASPKNAPKGRKVSGNISGSKATNLALGRVEVNSRDHAGLTILHRAASSTSDSAIGFALALIDHPAIDLYIQDKENGWTALHRALYFGNITIARAILDRDWRDPNLFGGGKSARGLIKVKDHEGNSPFDVYNATIATRSLQQDQETTESDDESSDDSGRANDGASDMVHNSLDGDEVFVFGSNKNHSLGFGDGDGTLLCTRHLIMSTVSKV